MPRRSCEGIRNYGSWMAGKIAQLNTSHSKAWKIWISSSHSFFHRCLGSLVKILWMLLKIPNPPFPSSKVSLRGESRCTHHHSSRTPIIQIYFLNLLIIQIHYMSIRLLHVKRKTSLLLIWFCDFWQAPHCMHTITHTYKRSNLLPLLVLLMVLAHNVESLHRKNRNGVWCPSRHLCIDILNAGNKPGSILVPIACLKEGRLGIQSSLPTTPAMFSYF